MEQNYKTVYVIVSCHFADWAHPCAATFQRINRGMAKAAQESYQSYLRNWRNAKFVATGNVPYEKGGATLAQLIKVELADRGVKPDNILIGEGVGIFSESESVPRQIKKCWPYAEKITVVSHYWYFWPGARLWKKSGSEHGFEVEISRVYGAGGLLTIAIYAVYGFLVWAAAMLDKILCPVFRFSALSLLGEQLSKIQSARKDGFKMNGCA